MGPFTVIKVSHDIPGVCWITMNRPQKYNAWNLKMYREMTPVLESANIDPNCKIIVLTGAGKFFTSGNDQNNFFDQEYLQNQNAFSDFIDLLIDITKPMIALVNGPAVGMGVTMLGHFDLILASDTATFSTPFTRLALCPEGCSSYLFPQIMGLLNANEMLLFNKKKTAQELLDCGLVSQVIPHHEFEEKTKAIVREHAQLSAASLEGSRRLMRSQAYRDKLHDVNRQESKLLQELSLRPEVMEAVMKFQSRKSKL